MKPITGKVVSTKMNKTIVVEVERRTPHPLYKKVVKKTKRFLVHNEDQKVQTGDTVKIVEIRPRSKNKHYKLEKPSK